MPKNINASTVSNRTDLLQKSAASTFDQVLRQAVVFQQAGRPQEAERLYRAILHAQPKHPDANHNLAVLIELAQKSTASLHGLKATLEANPNQSQSWLNYIDALIHTGHSDAALEVLRTARERGIRGEIAEALVRRLEAPIVSQPAQHEIDALVTLFTAGRYTDLLPVAQAMTERFPTYGFAWKVRGAVLKQLGRSVEALAPMQIAVALAPADANAYSNLAAIFQELNQWEQAEACCRCALQINPNDAEVHNNLGNALQSLGRFEHAVASYRHALEINLDYVEAHNNLGNALHGVGRLEEAVASYRRALVLKPDYVAAYNNLGNALQDLGQLEDALAIHRQVLKIKPDFVEVRFSLAQAAKVIAGDENMAALIELEESQGNGTAPRLQIEQAVPLHFALGKCYDDVGDYDNAFRQFLQACRLKRDSLTYDPEQTAAQFAAVQHNFDAASIERLRGAGDSSRLPIFVLGMPRSGSTLLSQIISSHPDVYSAGELPDLMEIAQRPSAGAGPLENLRLFDRPQLAAQGAEYVRGLQRHAPTMRRIIDKMPQNFLAVGLIHLMLPNAKIIHIKRNPIDTCLSCFTQLFTVGQEHTYDLTELGRYYVEYFRLMQHWCQVLPSDAWLEVDYEDLVAEQETQTRRILAYCELEWHDACIEPHKNKQAARTASRMQVRQPIYQSSMQRWRKYERHLGPLLDALGELAHQR